MRELFSIKSKKGYLKGFTLVELLVTVMIMIIMAAIAIPAYSKYEKENNFQSAASQMKAEVEKAYALAMNPEQGQTYYKITVNSTSIDLVDSNGVVESVNIPDNATLSASTPNYKYLICDSSIKDYCCVTNSSSQATCTAEPIGSVNFFTMTDTDVSKTATFTVNKEPFRVDLTIN